MKVKLLLSLFFVTMLGITGCSDEKATLVDPPEPIEEHTTEVQSVKVNESPAESLPPAEAVLSQFEIILANGESKFPTEDALLTDTTIGKNSILSLDSPEGENHYAIFLYGFDEQWFIEGVIRLAYLEKTAYTDKAGLALPMSHFNTANIKIGEAKEVWSFADEESLVTIARYDRFAFEIPGATAVSLKNGINAFSAKDQFNNPFLYYFDSEKLIVVSGNIDKEQLIDLANSLPSATSMDFPSSLK